VAFGLLGFAVDFCVAARARRASRDGGAVEPRCREPPQSLLARAVVTR